MKRGLLIFASVVAFSILPTQQAAAQHGHHHGHHHHGHAGHYGGHYGHGLHLDLYGLGHVGWGHYHHYPYYGGYYAAYPDYYLRSYGYDATYGPSGLSGVAPANSLPGAGLGAVRFTVINPPESTSALGFSLGGQVYTLEPGAQKEFRLAPSSIIEFDRGGAFGRARYTVGDGTYTFTPTDRGWELYHSRPAPGPPAS